MKGDDVRRLPCGKVIRPRKRPPFTCRRLKGHKGKHSPQPRVSEISISLPR